ncbi:MAG TPA: hypothetical protein VHC44_02750 [Verrucomicrobiae bacterium]|nr:hypothetical protein [Verrucomicrobiae bacterium]
MRLVKTIAWLTLAFWLVQSLAFIALFASSFSDLIVRLFIALGAPVPRTSLEAFLSGAMNVLSWPVRALFSSTWSQANTITAILLLALNSLIWAILIAMIQFFLKRNQPSKMSHS